MIRRPTCCWWSFHAKSLNLRFATTNEDTAKQADVTQQVSSQLKGNKLVSQPTTISLAVPPVAI